MFVLSGVVAVLASGLAYMTRKIREVETDLPDAIAGD